jgi:hypothetical protein
MDNRDRITDSTDGRIERAKDAALGKHDNHPSHADEAGEAVGGIGGVLAGAIGGWWSGRAFTEAASKLTTADDDYYRERYESSPTRLADRAYEDVRPAYHLGQIASQNPDYANQEWSEVQADLQRGWNAEHAKKYGEWSTVSGYASEGFSRGRSRLSREAKRSAEAFDQAKNA